MIGQSIEAKPRLSVGSILFLILGLVLLGVGLGLRNWNFAIGAAGPLILAGSLAWNRPRRFVAHFTEAELEIEKPARSIPYEDIESVVGYGRKPNPFAKGKKSYPIEILTPEGAFVIPGKLDVPSDQVYLFLYQRCEKRKKRRVPSPELRDYFKENLQRYGKERVHAFKTRSYYHISARFARRSYFVFLTLSLIGCGWFVCGLALNEIGWIGGGLWAAIVGLVLGGFLWLGSRSRRIRGWKLRNASLVISPDGLALIQGDLTGELDWSEVRSVKLGSAQFAGTALSYQLRSSTGKFIQVKVAGTMIPIMDIYDGPLPLIFQLISYYWRGEADQDTAERIWDDAEEAARRPDRRGDAHVTER